MTDRLLARLQAALAGRYVVERELGRGGMGIVYLARDVALERPVAIKLLPPELAHDPALRERFVQEARTAARLSHPNVVPIHAVESAGELAWFVMAFVAGESAGARVRRAGPLPAAEAARVLRDVAWALGYAHQLGVVHRDIKPDNVLLEPGTGRALVTDFGIARLTDGRGLTPPGEVMGTVAFASPEQLAGEALDGRSDLYSLGITAWFLLTGALPFDGRSPGARLLQAASAPPPIAARRPDLPPELAAAIDRCLAPSPEDRFPNAEALAAALEPRAAQAAVPLVVRRAQEEVEQLAGDVGSVAASAAMVLVQYLVLEFGLRQSMGLDAFAGFFNGIVVLYGGALLGARGTSLVLRLRAAAREGATAEGLAAAAPEGPPPPLGWGRRLAYAGAFALACWGWLNDFNGIVPDALQVPLGVLEIVVAVVVGRAAAQRLMEAKEGRWKRFWRGWAGRFLFRKATVGLTPAPAALDPAASAPTETLLAGAAERLFAALPPAAQERFDPFRATIRDLEAEAARLRARGAELEGLLAQVGPAHDGPQRQTRDALAAERDAAGRRLGTAVAALDAIRLELLRAQAGLAPTGSLTEHLEAAERLGEELDRRVAAEVEVRRLVRRRE